MPIEEKKQPLIYENLPIRISDSVSEVDLRTFNSSSLVVSINDSTTLQTDRTIEDSLRRVTKLIEKYNWKLIGVVEKLTWGYLLLIKNGGYNLLIFVSIELPETIPEEIVMKSTNVPLLVLHAGVIPQSWIESEFNFQRIHHFEEAIIQN